MPTRTRRALRRARRLAALLWWVGIALWAGLILGTQRPWAGLDELQATQWLLGGVGGMLVGILQRHGKDYWPANTMLGLAYGADKALYFGLLHLAFGGDVAAFRVWATAARLGLFAWGASAALLLWGLYLVVRVNRARDGSGIDLWGRPRPPSEEQAREALFVLARAHRHQLANVLMLPEYRELLGYLRRQEIGDLVAAELARRGGGGDAGG